ncbi:MAG TPA: hypothetical protein VKS98_07585 [Chthoniobacterales bacterium]|nr:hypothetical protein [Chthoniobacterales bacterium]
MISLVRLFSIVVVAFVFASCGGQERPKPVAIHPRPARAGEFDQVGTVTLYPGESCASQVVFLFHSGSQPVSMAAPFHVSKVLSEAAHNHKSVHVVGKWRRGKTADCTYIEATQADLIQKSFW